MLLHAFYITLKVCFSGIESTLAFLVIPAQCVLDCFYTWWVLCLIDVMEVKFRGEQFNTIIICSHCDLL